LDLIRNPRRHLINHGSWVKPRDDSLTAEMTA